VGKLTRLVRKWDAGIRTEQSVDGARVPTLRDPTPSGEDIRLTHTLAEGATLLGLRLHDT
jgi:hypothetical protein